MDLKLQAEKLKLLKSTMASADLNPNFFYFNVAGIEVRFNVYGEARPAILQFFEYYFKHFPSLNLPPEQVIHFYSQPIDSEFARYDHPYWNDPDDEFRISFTENVKNIIQRDFVAIEDPVTHEIFATGPTLTQGCCDSTDNLVQYALGRHLIPKNILPLHAATVIVKNKAYVFYGESGAGKSTLAEQSFLLDKFQMMSGDQILLKQTSTGLTAYANTTTIFGYHRDNPAWNHTPHPVAAVIHLLKAPRAYGLRSLSFNEAMPLILRETISWKEAVSSKHLLDLILKIGENKDISWGEFSYKKGDSFWSQLLKDLK